MAKIPEVDTGCPLFFVINAASVRNAPDTTRQVIEQGASLFSVQKVSVGNIAAHPMIVAPTDANFIATSRMDSDSLNVVIETSVEIKDVHGSIHPLIEGSVFAERFQGGVFCRSAAHL